ncbi:MAG: TolC family protein [Acidobacteriota bacterium]
MRPTTWPGQRGVLTGALCAATFFAVAAAGITLPPQEPRSPFEPGRAPMSSYSLSEAVALALRHDPAVHQARELTLFSQGRYQETSGFFDTHVLFDIMGQNTTSILTPGETHTQQGNRILLRQLAITLKDVADDLERQLQQSGLIPGADCPYGLDITLPDGSSICFSGRARASTQLTYDLAKTIGDDQLAKAIEDFARRRAEDVLDTLRLTEYASREILRNLGVVPTLQDRTSLDIGLQLPFQYRSGALLTPQISLEAVRDNYRAKPLNPGLGGKGVLNQFTSKVGVQLDVPLGKGWGRVSTGAPERAAELNYKASLDSEAHAMAVTVQQTSLAYWNLVAAQSQLAILERSAATEARLVEIGKALVEGGEVARADLTYVRARLAATEASVGQARQGVLQARITLANTIGLGVEETADAPLASESFPPAPGQDVLDAWDRERRAGDAFAGRADLASARTLRESARVLAEAARADLRRRLDLSLSCYYAGLWEGNSASDYHNVLLGFSNALTGFKPGPSALVSFTVTWPFKNNVAIGQLVQARSLFQQSAIKARDAERVASSRAEELLGAVRRAADEVRSHEAAVGYYKRILADEEERFKLGESTAINVVLTEENSLSEELSLVTARQQLATLISQLRFELGDLVHYRIEDGRVEVDRVDPLGYRAAAPSGG